MLRDYLREFGTPFLADDLCRVDAASSAVRLERRTEAWNAPEFTLDDVIAGLPWKKKGQPG